MAWKLKRGVDLICPKHGPKAALIIESPNEKRPLKVTCKGAGGRRTCRHEEFASEKQVMGILKAYPDCENRLSRESAWNAMFERPE